MQSNLLDADPEIYSRKRRYYRLSSSRGRNISIINKLKTRIYRKGLDTVQANLQLGLPADDRDFNVAIGNFKGIRRKRNQSFAGIILIK